MLPIVVVANYDEAAYHMHLAVSVVSRLPEAHFALQCLCLVLHAVQRPVRSRHGHQENLYFQTTGHLTALHTHAPALSVIHLQFAVGMGQTKALPSMYTGVGQVTVGHGRSRYVTVVTAEGLFFTYNNNNNNNLCALV